jgi:hypothetical protein
MMEPVVSTDAVGRADDSPTSRAKKKLKTTNWVHYTKIFRALIFFISHLPLCAARSALIIAVEPPRTMDGPTPHLLINIAGGEAGEANPIALSRRKYDERRRV